MPLVPRTVFPRSNIEVCLENSGLGFHPILRYFISSRICTLHYSVKLFFVPFTLEPTMSVHIDTLRRMCLDQ